MDGNIKNPWVPQRRKQKKQKTTIKPHNLRIFFTHKLKMIQQDRNCHPPSRLTPPPKKNNQRQPPTKPTPIEISQFRNDNFLIPRLSTACRFLLVLGGPRANQRTNQQHLLTRTASGPKRWWKFMRIRKNGEKKLKLRGQV